jgi:HK97 family phage prohead protease
MRDPEDFEHDSFRRSSREHEGKRYDVIMGKLKGEDAMTEQAYRYPKDIWAEGDARRHCKSHHGISFEPAKTEEATANMQSKMFHADIKKKSELDGHLIIEGWASTKNIDRADEIVEPEAFANGIKSYLTNPIVNFQHNTDMPIGKTIEMTIKDIEGFWIKVMLSKANDVADIVTKIKEGILRAFSIGFRPTEEPDIIDNVPHYKAIELYEVSVVSIPCNRESLFSIAKALKYGSDMVVPYDELVKDVEALKTKIIGAPQAPKIINPIPDGKVAPVTIPAPVPEERYEKFLSALRTIEREIVYEQFSKTIR